MYRAFLLLGELRYLYRLPKDEAVERLDAWLAWASRSKLKPFVKLARTIRQHKQGVLAAIELGHQQRTARGLEQPRASDQPPRPRIPLSRRPDRDGLPLLRRHHDHAPSPVKSPPNSTGEPKKSHPRLTLADFNSDGLGDDGKRIAETQ